MEVVPSHVLINSDIKICPLKIAETKDLRQRILSEIKYSFLKNLIEAGRNI